MTVDVFPYCSIKPSWSLKPVLTDEMIKKTLAAALDRAFTVIQTKTSNYIMAQRRIPRKSAHRSVFLHEINKAVKVVAV